MSDPDPNGAERPTRLGNLPWTEVADHRRDDPRFLLPVGSTLWCGPHSSLENRPPAPEAIQPKGEVRLSQ